MKKGSGAPCRESWVLADPGSQHAAGVVYCDDEASDATAFPRYLFGGEAFCICKLIAADICRPGRASTAAPEKGE
jgi:hypothetical protein